MPVKPSQNWVGASWRSSPRSALDGTPRAAEATNRLRRLIEIGECKKVIAWKLDRLGRKANEVLDFFRLCDQHGCAVVLVNEKFDTSGPFLGPQGLRTI